MAQCTLDSFGVKSSSLSVGSPPPTSQRSTPTPGPSRFEIPDIPAFTGPRKHPSTPPADTAARTPAPGIVLADSDRQVILQLSLQVERMEKALLSSQATSTNRIRKLEKQVASIMAKLHRTCQQHSSTPAPNRPTGKYPERGRSNARAPTPAPPQPQQPPTDKLSWAAHITAAAESNQQQFTTVSRKKKKPAPAPLIPKALPRIERELIIPTDTIFPPDELTTWAYHALGRINHLIKNTVEITQPPFTLARINSHNKIVLTTNPTTPASAYTPYMPMLLDEIKGLKPVNGIANSKWTKFLLHNIPTIARLAAVREMIESTYPTLKLMQEPHWLVPTERRLNKTASTIVISLQGTLSVANLGTNTIFIDNCKCRITEYFSWIPSTQCRNCQDYGHHTKLCRAEKPTCAICAQQHNTKDHQCLIPSCRAGKTCTHPPLKYAACGAAHRSTDPLCPVRISYLPTNRRKAPNTEQDEPMERNP
jgi:hypothetical protein